VACSRLMIPLFFLLFFVGDFLGGWNIKNPEMWRAFDHIHNLRHRSNSFSWCAWHIPAIYAADHPRVLKHCSWFSIDHLPFSGILTIRELISWAWGENGTVSLKFQHPRKRKMKQHNSLRELKLLHKTIRTNLLKTGAQS